MRKGRIIVVEGNIGAGKSTLIGNLASNLDVVQINESLTSNPYLPFFNSDPASFVLAMQFYLLANNYKKYKKAMRLADEGKDVILDRSLHSGYVFAAQNYADGNISKDNFDAFMKVRDTMLLELRAADLVLYLETDPEVCYNRVKNIRCRDVESSITLNYLSGINKYYKTLLSSFKEMKTEVKKIDWNNFGNIESVLSILK